MSLVSDAAIARLRAAAAWPEFGDPRYRVVREIGRGGMGTVYLGHDTALDREVAIKVANALPGAADLERRARDEAAILAALEHPGIVPIHDVGTLADGRLFTVMKLVRGVTLEEHLRAVPDVGERLRLFERLCEPVAFAHARGTVHRDLKPSNVMVGAFGEVLVMDWGIAKDKGKEVKEVKEVKKGQNKGKEGITDPGTVLGTHGFMAPEQAAGLAVDLRADVYALGAVLAELLRDGNPPKRLRAICDKAMSSKPEDRYAGAEALAADVVRFREGAPVLAYPEGPLERLGRIAVRYRTPLLLILTYLVIRVTIALIFKR